MSKFMAVFGKIFGFIPQAVMQVETLAGEKTGWTKKQAAIGIISTAAEIAGAVEGVDVAAADGALQSATGAGIDATVSLFNTLGILKHKSSGASAPSPAPAAQPAPAASSTPAPQAVHGTPSSL